MWVTTTLLLKQLDDGCDDAWARFVERYRDAIVQFARRFGVHDDDADDVAQETLTTFLDAWRRGRYQRDKGRLGAFLFGIATQQVRTHHRRAERQRRQNPVDSTFWAELPDDDTLRDEWEVAWERSLFARCLERVRSELAPSTVRAFELNVLEERPARETAAELGLSVNAVYVAKHRVLERVRELREGLEHVV